MEEIDRLFQLYDGKIDRYDLENVNRIFENNKQNDEELCKRTLSTYKSYRDKLIKLSEILNKKNEMLSEEFKVNVLRNLPMNTDMAIALANLLPACGVNLFSRNYNGILIDMYEDMINANDPSFRRNIVDFINKYKFSMSTPLYDILWHDNKYESEEDIRNNMINGSYKYEELKKIEEIDRHRLYKYGELISYEDVKKKLIELEKPDLAKRTIWASRDAGDGLGYDILSFLDIHNEFRLEVKTTKENDIDNIKKYNATDNDSFTISFNEMNIMTQNIDAYNIMRVFTNPTMARNNEDKILYLRLDEDSLRTSYAELVGIDFDGYQRKYIHEGGIDYKGNRKFVFKK